MGERKEPVYLGDGAYAREGHCEGDVELYCTDGIHEYSIIYLDSHVIASLLEFLDAEPKRKD